MCGMILNLLFSLSASVRTEVSVQLDPETYAMTPKMGVILWDSVAVGVFDTNNVNKSGIPTLKIEVMYAETNIVGYRAMGIAEAVLTKDLFLDSVKQQKAYLCSKFLKCKEDGDLPDALYDFFEKNLADLRKRSEETPAYYDQEIKNVLAQFDGLVEGLNEPNLPAHKLWTFLCRGELLNVARRLSYEIEGKVENDLVKDLSNAVIDREATAAVSIINSYEDMIVAHSSITGFAEMTKVSKTYVDQDKVRIFFTAYPFELSSIDTFIFANNGLMVVGAPLAVSPSQISSEDLSYIGNPSWLRVTVSLRISTVTDQYFDYYSSNALFGASNQYVVLDTSQFDFGHQIREGTATLLEEVLGRSYTTKKIDNDLFETKHLLLSGLPLTRATAENMGIMDLCNISERFCTSESVRKQILEDSFKNVDSFKDMKGVIRSNKVKSLEKQQGKAEFGVYPRFDLDQECRGAIDAKVTSIKRAYHGSWDAISGPAADECETFSFSTSQTCKNIDRGTLPDSFDTEWATNKYLVLSPK